MVLIRTTPGTEWINDKGSIEHSAPGTQVAARCSLALLIRESAIGTPMAVACPSHAEIPFGLGAERKRVPTDP